jgi:hypothetical protein
MTEFMPVKHVRVLHISAAAMLGDNSGVIGSFYRDVTASIQPVVDVHAAMGVVYIASTSVNARSNSSAIGGMQFVTAAWSGMIE